MSTFNELWGKSTPNSWARVPRGPAAAAVGSFLFGSTALASITVAGVSLATIGGFLITTAVASWAIGALMPKPTGASGREGILSNRREPVGSFDIVYGRVRKGGNITFMESTGSKNKYLHFVITLAGHEVEAIESIYINENVVELDGNGFVNADPWKGKIRIKKMLGGPGQVAQPQLVAETSVDSNFIGRGIAYLYVRLEYDNEVFAEGIPNFTAVIKGKKVLDPRTNQVGWSNNAALCIRDYLASPLGVNSVQSPESLQSDCWIEGANVCDSLVTKKDSSTEKRYTLNGIVPTSITPRENLQRMLTSCGGTLFWGQGQWQFKPGYFPSGPYINLGMDDLRSGISLITKNSRKENFNSASGVFVNSNKDWIETEYPRVSSSVFLAQDNGQENSLDIELPYTTSVSAAQRLAKMAMFRSREEIVISANFSLKASKIKVGDVVKFNFERYGFTDKFFEVLSWKLVSESSGLVINMTLKETSAESYDWNAEEKDILGNNTTLPQPREGLAVSGLVVTNRQTLQSDGTFLGEVLLSWNPAESAFVYRYDVQWRKNAESAWSSTQTTETEVVIPSVKSGIPYIYRVRAVSVGGFVGAWEQIGATVSGKDTPPGLPTNVQTKDLYRAVQITWNNPTDRDLNHIEVYTNTTNTSTGATLVGKSGGTKFIYDMEPMESRWFFVRAVDHSGNKSAFTAGKQGTALFIDSSDVDIDIDQLLEDAGLSAVEVLPNLPTTGNFDGRTVYNTSDRQLHIYDGATGTWKPAVEPFDPTDLVLERDNFPSDLKPVEVLSSLPTTGNFEGRVVMLLGDGKLYRYKNGAFTASVPTTDLTGTIGTAQIANNAINTAKFATGLRPVEVVSTLPTTGNVNGRTVVLTTDGKLYRYHSGSWTASVPTVDLTGTIVANQIADNAITETKISDDAISTPKLKANAITAGKIASNAISTDKLEANAVTAGKIASNSITTDKLEANAVTTAKIAAGAVTASEVAANAIIASKLAVSDLTNLIADDNVQDQSAWNGIDGTIAILSPTYGTGASAAKSRGGIIIYGTGNTGATKHVISRSVPCSSGDEFFFQVTVASTDAPFRARVWVQFLDEAGSATGSFYAPDKTTLGFEDVKGSSIPAPANTRYVRLVLSVTANEFPANHVVFTGPILRRKSKGELIVDGAIIADKIASNAITTDKIASNAITADKIEANAITAGKIAAGAVATDNLQAGAITASKITIADITNLVNDNQMQDSNSWAATGPFTLSTSGSNPLSDSVGNILVQNSESPIIVFNAPNSYFPVSVGQEFYVSWQITTNGTVNGLSALGGLQFFDVNDNSISIANVGGTVTSGSFNRNTGTVVVPSGAVKARFRFWRSAVTGSGNIIFRGPIARLKGTSELIVDGAIIASKIASNSVNTNHLVANAVTAGIIAAGAVSASAIQSSAVTADKIEANAVTAIKIQSNAVTADKINVTDLSAISANLGSIQVGTANISDGAVTNAKIGNVIQSTNYVPGGSGWRIAKGGAAEFDNVTIRRQLSVASGTINVGTFTPRSIFATELSGSVPGFVSGPACTIERGPSNVLKVLTTPVPITEWNGAKKTYLVNAGMSGTVTSETQGSCYFGWTGEVLPLTKWDGNQSLRLVLYFWCNGVIQVKNCNLTWRIYEVS